MLAGLPLFASARAPEPAQRAAAASPEPSALEVCLAEVDPDAITPLEALELVYRLKSLAVPRR